MVKVTICCAVVVVLATAGAQQCNSQTWSAGHDFKNRQYSNVKASSPGDCCAKCAKYSDKTIGQCKFWTFDGVDTCWLKSNNQGYRAGDKKITCGSVDNVPLPTPPPTPPPTPAPPTPAPLPPSPTPAPTPWDGKPVQVYIMMGQSNMLGEGQIFESASRKNGSLEFAVREEGKYQYLLTPDKKNWAVLPNTRNVFVMGNGNGTYATSKLENNESMTIDPALNHRKTIGPEFGIAQFGGSFKQDKVMLLKSCIGDRALGWDLLPPGSARFDYTGNDNVTYTYAGYGESPMKWKKSDPKPAPIGWYAGAQWDGDTRNAQYVLDHIDQFYPGAQKYEIAGFFWWQGDKDSRDMGLSTQYEKNLVTFIKQLRSTFKAPNAPFVTASLGQTVKGSTSGDGLILDAMLNVDGESGKYPDFKGNVAAVYTNPLMHVPSSSGGHYGKDGETYMNVGEAMGAAMAKLKQGKQ